MFSFTRALFAGALLSALPLAAAPFTLSTGSSLTMNFDGFYSASKTTIPGLSGQVILSNFNISNTMFAGQTATIVTLDYTVKNTSVSPNLTSRITNFAINTTPNILTTAPNSVSGIFDTVSYGANQPNGVGAVELCWATQGCPGGGGGGVDIGASSSGSATIYFAGNFSSFDIDSAYLRYQSVTCSSGSPCNASASGSLVNTTFTSSTPPSGIPEPSSFGLLSLGLAGFAVWFRKSRRS